MESEGGGGRGCAGAGCEPNNPPDDGFDPKRPPVVVVPNEPPGAGAGLPNNPLGAGDATVLPKRPPPAGAAPKGAGAAPNGAGAGDPKPPEFAPPKAGAGDLLPKENAISKSDST